MARRSQHPQPGGTAPQAPARPDRIPLTQAPRGAVARIACTDALEPCDQFLLETLGLAHDTCVRVCRASGSCILEVGAEHGHTSRIALARNIADKVLVGLADTASAREA